MGKTYRKEQPYKKVREEGHNERHVDHDHERTDTRRRLHEVKHHWQDAEFEDDEY